MTTKPRSRLPSIGRNQLLLVAMTPKPEAVCRAGRRGGCSRCAVRMTARGSVTPGMACGSRPVERIPELGALPTVGINQRPGVKGEAFSPLARPRQQQVGKSPKPTGRNRIKPNPRFIPRLNPLRQAQGERLAAMAGSPKPAAVCRAKGWHVAQIGAPYKHYIPRGSRP